MTDEEIIDVIRRYKISNSFVETGTYKGNTTRLASQYFNKVYTIEIHKGLYEESVEKGRHEKITNIEYHLGDSLEKLPLIASKCGQTVWFLDAHISGSDSSWNNKIRVPLLEELEIILQNNKHKGVFILDDFRFFSKVWDWAHISKETIKAIFVKYGRVVSDEYEKDDRYYVVSG